MQRIPLISILLMALTGGVMMTQVASCSLEQYGGTAKPTTAMPCISDANCIASGPCMRSTCNLTKSLCEESPAPDGNAPDGSQIPKDCKRVTCSDGVASTVNDAQDIPSDNNTCTNDVCTNGVPSNPVLADDTACLEGSAAGVCTGGVCIVSCDASKKCDDSNPCTDDYCNIATSRCVFTDIDGLPTPGFQQVAGDCHQQLCIAGMSMSIVDDGDVGDDKNSCTQNLCTDGANTYPGQPAGTPCMLGDVNVCDGVSACVACTLPVHCQGIVEDECTQRACVNNQCEPAYSPSGTLASPALQQPGDCKKTVCDGAGKTMVVNDDTEIPDDGLACTMDTCSNGTKVFTPVAAGASCGMGQVCNATGQCVGCNVATDCVGVDDACKTRTCTMSGMDRVCGYDYQPDGTPLMGVQSDQDCKIIVCDGVGNTVTRVDMSDLPVDGNPCTKDLCSMTGTPSNPNETIKTTCNANGGDVCDGNGACKKSDGITCSDGAECLNSNCIDTVCCDTTCGTTCMACNVIGKLGTCTNVPPNGDDAPNCSGTNISCDGMAVCKKENGQTCSMDVDCLSNHCIDGVCCNSTCNETCKACNVAQNEGTCTFLPAGSQDANPMNACGGTKQCDGSGMCVNVAGSACTNGGECPSMFCVDGVCCNSACDMPCQACNLAGSAGMCTAVAAGNPDPGCSPVQTCNATSQCVLPNGQACTAATQCASGFCNDGVCCDAACTQACKSCNLPASVGTCSNIPPSQEDANASMMCTGNNSCDGAGNCTKDTGQGCAVNSECSSSFCVDGFCCESACQGTCKACNLTVKGVCSNIPANMDDNNAMTACTGANQSCDGMGVCKRANGQACTNGNNSECLSNFCVDGYCCNSACTNTCQACNRNGNLGSCVNVSKGTEDTYPMNACSGTMACDGGGTCKLKNGQPCSGNGDCASNKCSSGTCVP